MSTPLGRLERTYLTPAEQRKVDRSATFRWLALVAILILAVGLMLIGVGLFGVHVGYERGLAQGLARRDETPRAAFNCKEAVALCRSELHRSLKQ